MFTLRRVTTEPGSPIKVMVDNAQGDGDAGLTLGGAHEFYPAGAEDGGDVHQVSEAAAAAVMGDPELAKHFECSPTWKPAEDANQGNTSGARKRGKPADQGNGADGGPK